MRYTKQYRKFLLTTTRKEIRLAKLKQLSGVPFDLSDIKDVKFNDLTDGEIENLVKFIVKIPFKDGVNLIATILTKDYTLQDNSPKMKRVEMFLGRPEFASHREKIFNASDI